MSFPALPYEVDEHLVRGMRSLYAATDSFREIPLDLLDPKAQLTVREVIGRTDALKDALYVLRHGRERTNDVPPEDLIGTTSSFKRMTAVTKRIYELIADGEWHDYSHVVREAAKEVLPGEAHRYMETTRTSKGGPEERTKNFDPVKLVEKGQRAIAVSTISGLARIEMDPPRSERAEQRRIRLRPPNLTRDRRLAATSQMSELDLEPVADAAAHAPDDTQVST